MQNIPVIKKLVQIVRYYQNILFIRNYILENVHSMIKFLIRTKKREKIGIWHRHNRN